MFYVYEPLKDAKTGLPLFNTAAWGVAKNILDLISKGFVSDSPGIALYSQIGIDAKAGGLPVYPCMRGTNLTDGGVHTHLCSQLPTSGVSVRHFLACLNDFTLRHNLLVSTYYDHHQNSAYDCHQVGTYNSTGQHYHDHYSIWLTNEPQERLVSLHDILINPSLITNWVNGNLYEQASEVSGILLIPSDIRQQSGMSDYDPLLDHK